MINRKIKIFVGICIMLAIAIMLIFIMKTKQKKENKTEIPELAFEYSAEDEYDTWDASDATYIAMNDENNKVKIEKEGTYCITGTTTNGSIIVDADKEDTIQLILNNVNITSADSSPIYVKKAKKVILTLEENSTNTLIDGTEYIYDDTTKEEPNATIFSKEDLTINGSGTLNIKANFEDGIASKDGLVITNGNINIEAVDDGIRGKDYVAIKTGNIKIVANSDGIKSTEDTDTEKGYVIIDGGNIDITTKGDQTEQTSSKGIKAVTNIQVNAGDITINSTDDAIHSNNNITINGGNFNIQTGDDGIHSDTSLYINNGTIDISKSYEGIESSLIEINGGNISIVSSDDGINVAGGNDNSFMGGRGGRDNFNPPTSSDNNSQKLIINAGEIYVNALGDGIDINGSGYINGGTITVDGPISDGDGALDYDGELVITNGTLIACGSSGMMQSVSNSSSVYCLSIIFSQTQNAGSKIRIEDENNNNVVTYIPSKQYQSSVICSPNFSNGKKYKIYVDETQIDTVTIENTVTNVGMNKFFPNEEGIPQMPNGNPQKPEGTMQKPRR